MEKESKIAFFNEAAAFDDYAASGGNSTDGTLIVGMYPSTRFYMEQKDFKSRDTTPYFTNDSHVRVIEKSDELVKWVRNRCETSGLGFIAASSQRESFVFWARILTNYSLRAIETAANAVDEHSPEVLAAALSGAGSVQSTFIEPEERYLGRIVERLAESRGIIFEDTSKNARHNITALFLEDVKGRVFGLVTYLLRRVKFSLWERKVVKETAVLKKRPILFTTRRYQMDKLAAEFIKEAPEAQLSVLEGPIGVSFDIPGLITKMLARRRAKEIEGEKKILEGLITAIGESKGVFLYRGVSFADLIAEKLRHNISGHIVSQFVWAMRLDVSLGRLNPQAVVSAGNRPDDMMIAELCKKRSIPAVLISHGSHVKPKNEYERIEWGEHGKALLGSSFSINALQSPLMEGFFEVFPSGGKAVRTGPLTWGRPVDLRRSRELFSKMFGGKYESGKVRIIVHAGTAKRSRVHVYETFDEYVKAVRELAEAVEKISEAILIVKFRPLMEITTEAFKSLVPFSKKVILSIDEPFGDVLGMADLLVSFSSTTIEEALQNRTPVLLYGGGGRYQHTPASEVSGTLPAVPNAVYHVTRQQDLEHALKEILRLDVKNYGGKAVFEPYIYAKETRVSLSGLLKTYIS